MAGLGEHVKSFHCGHNEIEATVAGAHNLFRSSRNYATSMNGSTINLKLSVAGKKKLHFHRYQVMRNEQLHVLQERRCNIVNIQNQVQDEGSNAYMKEIDRLKMRKYNSIQQSDGIE